MQWEVGCGNVNANHMPILQQLESTSSDSSMSQAVGHGIIGWHVTNNKPHSPHRMKVILYFNRGLIFVQEILNGKLEFFMPITARFVPWVT